MRNEHGSASRSSVRSQSLLERLRADDQGDVLLPEEPLNERVQSIKSNIVRLLNTRQGGSVSSPGYGLSDLNDASVGSADMLNAIARDVRAVIQTYEPRVERVSVEFDQGTPNRLELHFRVSLATRINHQNQQTTIDLVLKEGRRFALR